MKLRQRTLVCLVAGLMVAACVGSLEAQGRRGGQGGRPQFGQGGPGGRGGFPGMMGGGMMGGGMMMELGLLRRDDVRKELELLDDQIAALEKIDAGGMMRSAFEGVPREEMRERMPQIMEETRKKVQKEVDSILLPHQATRLSQLAVQNAMRSTMGLVRGEVADKLGLTEQQREQLAEKARQIREDLEKQAVAQLIKELPAAQQKKIEQLMGKPFTFQDEPRERPQDGGAFGRRRGD